MNVVRIAVLGAGLTGVSTALELARRGWDVDLTPEREWLYRYKRYKIGGWLPASAPAVVPSVTFVLGPFGDVADFGARGVYFSWYPTGMVGSSRALEPPDWEALLSAADRRAILRRSFEAASARCPALAALGFAEDRADPVGGVIFAWGATDIDAPESSPPHPTRDRDPHGRRRPLGETRGSTRCPVPRVAGRRAGPGDLTWWSRSSRADPSSRSRSRSSGRAASWVSSSTTSRPSPTATSRRSSPIGMGTTTPWSGSGAATRLSGFMFTLGPKGTVMTEAFLVGGQNNTLSIGSDEYVLELQSTSPPRLVGSIKTKKPLVDVGGGRAVGLAATADLPVVAPGK